MSPRFRFIPSFGVQSYYSVDSWEYYMAGNEHICLDSFSLNCFREKPKYCDFIYSLSIRYCKGGEVVYEESEIVTNIKTITNYAYEI